jgi:hypothetical protein
MMRRVMVIETVLAAAVTFVRCSKMSKRGQLVGAAAASILKRVVPLLPHALLAHSQNLVARIES